MASSTQNLEEMYENLSFEEEEGVLFDEREGGCQQNTYILVGSFLTVKNINFMAMQSMMASLWIPREGVEIHDLGNHRYSFVFFHSLDIQKVIDGGPWSFESNPLVYHRLRAMEDANLVPLNKMEIWVQVHDLPSGMVSEKILDSIGSQVGDVIKLDPTDTNGMWKQYMRIRVALNIEKPLKRRIKLKRENGSWSWINFK
ncbi:uncharacterized protein LOC141685700 [Apium graveolens]|uniref:uncharacterized protein LOC141685700 n=1 Tax=Apium graveolens TaxID=4045 RepID=UPI003D790FA8